MFKNMTRPKLNFLVDLAAFFGFIFLISTGFILRYVLPPGSGGIHGFGVGRRAMERPIALLWGLTRHEWGDIHFWMSIIFLAFLAVHLFLHWQWVGCMIKGEKNEYSGARFALGVIGLITIVAILVAPFFSEKTNVARSQLIENYQKAVD